MTETFFAKALAAATIAGFACAMSVPAQADDIPATPMNHSGFSMPTSASAGIAHPPPPPAEPAIPAKPMKKKKMSKKMKKDDMAGGAPAAPEGKM